MRSCLIFVIMLALPATAQAAGVFVETGMATSSAKLEADSVTIEDLGITVAADLSESDSGSGGSLAIGIAGSGGGGKFVLGDSSFEDASMTRIIGFLRTGGNQGGAEIGFGVGTLTPEPIGAGVDSDGFAVRSAKYSPISFSILHFGGYFSIGRNAEGVVSLGIESGDFKYSADYVDFGIISVEGDYSNSAVFFGVRFYPAGR